MLNVLDVFLRSSLDPDLAARLTCPPVPRITLLVYDESLFLCIVGPSQTVLVLPYALPRLRCLADRAVGTVCLRVVGYGDPTS